jgi:hypothetical protein
MRYKGMYLTPWDFDFNSKEEISSTLIWVRLPHLPLISCDDNSLIYIGNKRGRFINREKPKGNLYSYAHICVEVDSDKGLLEALQINLDGQSH